MAKPEFANNKSCHICLMTFDAFKRRHHCRKCGGSTCDTCSKRRVCLPEIGYKDNERVCDLCYEANIQDNEETKEDDTPCPPPYIEVQPAELEPSLDFSAVSNAVAQFKPVDLERCREISTQIRTTILTTHNSNDEKLENVRGKLTSLGVKYSELACDAASYVSSVCMMAHCCQAQIPALAAAFLNQDSVRVVNVIDRLVFEIGVAETQLKLLIGRHNAIHMRVSALFRESHDEYLKNSALFDKKKKQLQINHRTADDNIEGIAKSSKTGAKLGMAAGSVGAGLIVAAEIGVAIAAGPVGWLALAIVLGGAAAAGGAAGAAVGATGASIEVGMHEVGSLISEEDMKKYERKMQAWLPVFTVAEEINNQLTANQKDLKNVMQNLNQLRDRALAGKILKVNEETIVSRASSWNPEQCINWLRDNGLEEVIPQFRTDCVDGESLLTDVDAEYVEELGLKSLKRKRFLRLLDELKQHKFSPEIDEVTQNLSNALTNLSNSCEKVLDNQQQAASKIQAKRLAVDNKVA